MTENVQTAPVGDQAAPTPAPEPTPAPPAGASWRSKLPGDLAEWADAKGYKSDLPAEDVATMALQSYNSLEKLFGADKAGRTVQLPKDESDTAALDAIFDRLGRPKDANGYEIKIDGADEKFLGTAKGWFHKAGLLPKQAQMVAELYRAAELDSVRKVQQDHATEIEGLEREWGPQFEQKVEVGKAAAKAAGMPEEDIKAAEAVWGPAKAAKYFEFFGRNYVEAQPPGAENRTQTPGFAQHTPATAKAKMDALYGDRLFMERYNSPDPKVRAVAMAEMDALAKLAVNAKM